MELVPGSPKLAIEVWRTVDREEAGRSKAGQRKALNPLRDKGEVGGRWWLLPASLIFRVLNPISDSLFFIDKD